MIITKHGKAYAKLKGKCHHCGCQAEMERCECYRGPSGALQCRCPECGDMMAVEKVMAEPGGGK